MNLRSLIFLAGFTWTLMPAAAQTPTFTCENQAYSFLEKIIGKWEVKTRDRTSPGEYENNSGISEFSNLISGCGVRESFRGKFRGKDYAREVQIVGKDTASIQMTVLDSEHGRFSVLNGTIENDGMVVYWYRENEESRLRSKYILTFKDPDHFEFSSWLSTDYGENWALTHERIYSKMTEK